MNTEAPQKKIGTLSLKKGQITDLLKTSLASPFSALLACFISGAVGAFAMPPYGVWPALVFGISLFYTLISESHSKALSFGMGWMFGFGYFLVGLHWIGNALLVDGNPYQWAYPLALCGLPALLALFPAFASLAIYKANLKTLTGYIFFVAVFGGFEWLRGTVLTGFPWNLFGYSWAYTPEIAQSASIIGIYGLSLLTIAGFALPAFIIRHTTKNQYVWMCGFVITGIFLSAYIYGFLRLHENPTQYDPTTQIIIAQPNIKQSIKWDENHRANNYIAHLEVSKHRKMNYSFRNDDRPERTFLIWPESAINPVLLENSQAMGLIRTLLRSYDGKSYLVSGTMRAEKPDNASGQIRYYNSIIVMDERAHIIDTYDKNHLVPFGEYIPLSSIFNIGPVIGFTNLEKGRGRSVMSAPSGPAFIPQICYEAIFPYLSRSNSQKQKPEWIVNATNDAWYGNSAGPPQHLRQASFRAIEQGLPLIRSANTGISAITDPYGRILQKIDFGTAGKIISPLPKKADRQTLYSQINDVPYFLIILIMLIVGIWPIHKAGKV